MIELVLVAIGIWLGASPARLALLVGAVLFPWAAAALAGLHWWRNRETDDRQAVNFCEAVAAELRAGAPPRFAIAAAAHSTSSRGLARSADRGESMAKVAGEARRAFPGIGPELAACITRGASLGSPMADLFEEIGALALARDESWREMRAAMAPARASVLVLIAGPIGALWWANQRGDLGEYLSAPAQRISVAIGATLCFLALGIGLMMMRTAR